MSTVTTGAADAPVVALPAHPAPSPVGDAGWSLSLMRRVSLAGGEVLGALPGARWMLVLSGGLSVETPTGTVALGAGDAALVDARTAHRAVGSGGAAVPADVVVADLRAAPGAGLPGLLVVRNFAGRHAGVAALVQTCQLGGECRRTDLFTEGYGTLIGAALTASWLDDRPSHLARCEDPTVAAVVAQVSERPGEAWTVDRMAGLVHLSRSALGERFRRALGRGPAEVLRDVRMREARRLLRDLAHPVEHVAHLVGYGSTAAFSRAFSNHHGTGPQAWRERSGARGAQGGEPRAGRDRGDGARQQRGLHAVPVQQRAS